MSLSSNPTIKPLKILVQSLELAEYNFSNNRGVKSTTILLGWILLSPYSTSSWILAKKLSDVRVLLYSGIFIGPTTLRISETISGLTATTPLTLYPASWEKNHIAFLADVGKSINQAESLMPNVG